MSARARLALALLACALGGAVEAGERPDRLERFRALAATRLSATDPGDLERAPEGLREIYALLDEEIVESLQSGGLFSSLAFLQDRLDGFADVWGGAAFRLIRLGRLTIGAFQLSDGASGNSVRVYGTVRQEAQLLGTLHREGRPVIHALPPAAGAAQLLVSWEGAPSGRGTRALRLDLARQRGDDVRVVWSTADVFPDGLYAREWRVRGGDIRIRYELHYPGWIPGCERQTEQEDVYRLTGDGTTFARIGRRQFEPWHQALHRAVAELFAVLAAGNRTTLAALVPNPQLRDRLPATLAPEPACDAPDASEPASVSVAAVAAQREPWTLTWERAGARWRLTDARPVLQ